MCNYLKLGEKGLCTILNNQCPYTYFCTKTNTWKENKNFPKNCNVKEKADIPKGYHEVCFEKHGNLYVNVDGNIRIIPNPFGEEVPKYVKAYLSRGVWKVKK